jgi:hypothetical protein
MLTPNKTIKTMESLARDANVRRGQVRNQAHHALLCRETSRRGSLK